ncbi:MAG: hypothetical protein RR202_00005, partial [Bacteroidales bacterium]
MASDILLLILEISIMLFLAIRTLFDYCIFAATACSLSLYGVRRIEMGVKQKNSHNLYGYGSFYMIESKDYLEAPSISTATATVAPT